MFNNKEAMKGCSLFLLRVLVGLIFVWHGYPKIGSAPALLGLPGEIGMLVGIVEIVFGVLLIVGVWFPHILYPLFAVIIVALLGVQIPGAIERGVGSGLERDLLIFVSLIVMYAFGFGKWAFSRKKKR